MRSRFPPGGLDFRALKRYDGHMLITSLTTAGLYRVPVIIHTTPTGAQELWCCTRLYEDGTAYTFFEVAKGLRKTAEWSLPEAIRQFNRGHVEPLDKNV